MKFSSTILVRRLLRKGAAFMNNIEVFLDTKSRIEKNSFLRLKTEESKKHTRVYHEDFFSHKQPLYQSSCIRFEENTTLEAARKYSGLGKKIGILNFANPIEPGGGVLRGASAQEEYLCRATNLYPCLISKSASEWYEYHRGVWEKAFDGKSFLASDRVIYSPGITVFRKDDGYRPILSNSFLQTYTDQWYEADVITSSAPFFFSKENVLPEKDLECVFKRRIRNILEVAAENDIQILILGAFGCGAFNNPPRIVARAFYEVLTDLRNSRYRCAFEEIVFAVMRTGTCCKNIAAFEAYFVNFPYMSVFTPEYIRAHEFID